MIGSFTEAPIISVRVIFWTLFLRQGFISAFDFSRILRWLKAMATRSSTLAWKIPWAEEPGGLQSMGSWRVRHDWATSFSLRRLKGWWHNNLSLSQHKVLWVILIFDDQVASKLQINPPHILVSVLFLTSGSFNGGIAVRIPDLVWECYLYIWGSQKHLPSCETSTYHDLEQPSFHILFHESFFWDVLDTLTLHLSKINSLATPVKAFCKLQSRMGNSFSAFLELCVKQFHCKWSLVITWIAGDLVCPSSLQVANESLISWLF